MATIDQQITEDWDGNTYQRDGWTNQQVIDIIKTSLINASFGENNPSDTRA